jgi:CHAT domain-containing protein/tetratricopeptide (TPR) repeat protein
MMNEAEVLAVLQAKIQRGSYTEVVKYAQTLSTDLKRRPAIVLKIARTFLRQGRPIDAESALANANLDLATPGEKLILTIEAAAVQIHRHIAIRAALETAAAAFAAVQNTPIDPVDRAAAERVQIRILLTAAIYYEISPEEGQVARDRLPEIAEILAQAGHLDESLAARLTYTERLDDLSQKIEALANLSDYAISVDRPVLAGEIRLIQAEQMLTAGATSDAIRSVLDIAASLYTQTDCAHGLIDVRRVGAKLAIDRELASPEVLEACLADYQQLDFPKGTLNILMDLSQIAHDRGDTSMAKNYRQQTINLAASVGMGIAKDSFQTAQIDLLMRNNDYGEAIERCQAAIASDLPTFSKAGYEQLLATAYSFINNFDQACWHGRKAKEMFEEIGAIDSASDSVVKLANDLSSLRQDENWQEAEELLKQWIVKDAARGDFDAAVNKREVIAQLKIEQFLYSPSHRGQWELLAEAERDIEAAEALTNNLSQREAAKRLGSMYQLRGQIYQAKGAEDDVIQTWREALAVYDRAGLEMNVANCHYILGAIYLNRASQDLMANFGEAESNFHQALTYYDTAGMRGQAADTCFMFAQLYIYASNQENQDLRNQFLDAAIGYLTGGESNYDAIRREFTTGGSVLEIQLGKRAVIEKSQRIYELALRIFCVFRPDPVAAWNWAQRSKARSLADVLGIGSVPPTRIMVQIEQHPDSFKLLLEEREIAARIDKVTFEERIGLRQMLDDVWERMKHDPYLSEYLDLRTGTALEADDLVSLITTNAETAASSVCIDWIAVGERLFLLALRPDRAPQLVELSLRLSQIQSFINNNLRPSNVLRSSLRDTPEVLRELDPLIAPLRDLSAPEELLIFSPTGLLNTLPLHALEIEGKPLLARNLIVYCPSLSVLRHCLARRKTRKEKPTVALFGDPSGDRPEAAKLMLHLEQCFGTKPLIQEAVTREAFTTAISSCDSIHFQGHAVHKPHEPLESYLELADSHLTAREIFNLPNLQAELVTLGACESAANVIETGDEPLGLIPAFLYAGTSSVLATLWRVNQTSAAETMRLFYNKLIETDPTINKAQALRQAMLTVRDTPGFDSPYHWAPFVLYGNWH